GRIQDAEKPCRDAIAIQEKLVADFPKVPSYWSDLAGSYQNLLELLNSLNRWPEALAAFEKAKPIYQRLVTDSPEVADYQSDFGDNLAGAARIHQAQGQWAKARELLEDAIGRHRAAFNANTNHERYRNGLYHDYDTLAICLVNLGEHRAAAKAAAELPVLYPKGRQAQFTAAQLLAFCATLAGKDAKLADAERAALVQMYGDQAMEQLRGEVKHAQLRPEHVRQDIVFEPLRPRNDFQQLLSELDRTATDQSPRQR